jgi:tetratricopeptide (TPR) repeat protein
MQQFGVRDVEELLRVPRSTIRSLIKAGFVSPARGPRNAYRFSFQDLIVLRAARALATANVSPQRITRSLKRLRRHLPAAVPLSGLSICAVADRVVVKEGRSRWQADSGQYLLALDVESRDGSLSLIERDKSAPPVSAEEWFSSGYDLERSDTRAAQEAYRQAITSDASHLGARINLGRLLHEAGRLADAERVYRDALAACGSDALLLYNLALVLEDLDRKDDARAAYEAALRENPRFADCHYNLALLYQELNRPKQALRHLAQYRKLAGTRVD